MRIFADVIKIRHLGDHHGLFGWDLTPKTSNLIREEIDGPKMEDGHARTRSQDRSEAATSQGTPGSTRS